MESSERNTDKGNTAKFSMEHFDFLSKTFQFNEAKRYLDQAKITPQLKRTLLLTAYANIRNYELNVLRENQEQIKLISHSWRTGGTWDIARNQQQLIFHGEVTDKSEKVALFCNSTLVKIITTHQCKEHRTEKTRFGWAMLKEEANRFPPNATLSIVTRTGILPFKSQYMSCKLKNRDASGTIEKDLAKGYVFYKNGNMIPRRDEDKEWQELMLKNIKKTCYFLKNKLKVEPFIIGGTLLSAMRDGNFIPHDGDVDIAYISETSSAKQAKDEIATLHQLMRQEGWESALDTTCCIKPFAYGLTDAGQFDIFPVWFRDGVMFTPPWHAYPLKLSSFLPIKHGKIAGHLVPIPAEPEKILEFWYGRNWYKSDPTFQPSTAPEGEQELELCRFRTDELKYLNKFK